MPFYEYRCVNEECLNQIEVVHGMNEEYHEKCELCNSDMKKIYSTCHQFTKGNSRWEDIKKDPSFKRDKHIYDLENNDPYKHMRTKEDYQISKDRLNNIGKRNYDKDGNYTGKKFIVNNPKSKNKK